MGSLKKGIRAPLTIQRESEWLDLLMLVYAGGRERSRWNTRAYLASAGFALERPIPTKSAIGLLEARPVWIG